MLEERYRKLMASAIDEFNLTSFNDASLNNILSNAGISKGSFYNRFKTKTDLFIALFEEAIQYNVMSLEQAKTSSITFGDLITAATETGIILSQQHPKQFIFSRRAILESEAEVKKRVGVVIKKFSNEQLIQQVIKPNIESGQLKRELSLEFYEMLMFDMVRVVNEWVICVDDMMCINIKETRKRLKEYLIFVEKGINL